MALMAWFESFYLLSPISNVCGYSQCIHVRIARLGIQAFQEDEKISDILLGWKLKTQSLSVININNTVASVSENSLFLTISIWKFPLIQKDTY